MEVLHDGVVYNKVVLVPLKRGIEGVGIDDENEKDYAGNMDQRAASERPRAERRGRYSNGAFFCIAWILAAFR